MYINYSMCVDQSRVTTVWVGVGEGELLFSQPYLALSGGEGGHISRKSAVIRSNDHFIWTFSHTLNTGTPC